MKKFLFFVFLLVLGGLIYAVGAFQIVKGDESVTIRKKKEFGFNDFVVEPSRAEKVVDFIKDKVNEVDWKGVRRELEQQWQGLSTSIDDMIDDTRLKEGSEGLEKDLAELREEAVERYEKLVARLEDGDLSTEKFQDKLQDLLAWLEKKLDGLRAKMEG